ncbi:hypothetical protein BDN70DRAFT_927514 [Pholiota conissans]|uniref:Uncharacterized protein n=1 Tax=Pholiota conissans TaxID=109636 RepID=A0A9P6CYS3_9AGAR|nr:hypothetical protein BDN70DRAFT_927514 [Pholiota conissans]
MAMGHSNFRRQHAGAAHRRAPVPQNGFDPDAYLSALRGGGEHTDLFPTQTPIDSIIPSPTTTTTTTTPVLPTDTPATTSTTSTTSTSTSTSTTSTPSTTSTSTTPVVAPSTTTPVATTTLAPKTDVVTTSIPRTITSNTAAAASVSSSTSSIPDTTSGSSTGPLVGGIIAGIAVLIAVIFAVVFFIRRSRKRDSFNEGDFRRSAMILNDPPTHEDTVARGFNPSSPSMVERQTASPAPTFGTQYGRPGEYANNAGYGATNNAGYGASMNNFGPGQIINVNAAPAHPMYSPHPQSPYEQYYPQNVQSPVLTRQASNSSSEAHRQMQSPTEFKRESLPANDYVDLSRSSVSPFQAAQYVEISRRLNAEVPEGLRTADVDRDLPPLPPVEESSPFDDPASAPPSPGAQYAIDRRNIEEPTHIQDPAPRPVSTDSIGTAEHAHNLDFPVPPSPVMTPTSRYRIESLPPMLPEINVESRVSVGGYPMLNARDSGAPSAMTMLTPGVASASGSRFPMTPSPLASSFGMPTPVPAAAFPDTPVAPAPPTPRTPPVVPQDPKKRDTTYSMYDPEDAYGGI